MTESIPRVEGFDEARINFFLLVEGLTDDAAPEGGFLLFLITVLAVVP